MFKNSFDPLLSGIEDISVAAKNKGLAQLGDEIINMCFSIAKSVFLKKCIGEKVNMDVLSEGLKRAGLRDFAKRRASKHDIADSAEAIIAYTYLNKKISFDEIIDSILSGMNKSGFIPETKLEELEIDIQGVLNLFNIIKKRMI